MSDISPPQPHVPMHMEEQQVIAEYPTPRLRWTVDPLRHGSYILEQMWEVKRLEDKKRWTEWRAIPLEDGK